MDATPLEFVVTVKLFDKYKLGPKSGELNTTIVFGIVFPKASNTLTTNAFANVSVTLVDWKSPFSFTIEAGDEDKFKRVKFVLSPFVILAIIEKLPAIELAEKTGLVAIPFESVVTVFEPL